MMKPRRAKADNRREFGSPDLRASLNDLKDLRNPSIMDVAFRNEVFEVRGAHGQDTSLIEGDVIQHSQHASSQRVSSVSGNSAFLLQRVVFQTKKAPY